MKRHRKYHHRKPTITSKNYEESMLSVMNENKRESQVFHSDSCPQIERSKVPATKKNTYKQLLIVLLIPSGIFLTLSAFILPSILTYLFTYRLSSTSIHRNRYSPLNQSMKYYCMGVSPWTRWTNYTTVGISMSIDTRSCNFNSTPVYYTSISGKGFQERTTSSRALYSPFRLGFSLYLLKSESWDASEMLNYSQIYQWDVNWVGLES